MPFAAKRAECWVEFRTDGGWGITRISGRPEGSMGRTGRPVIGVEQDAFCVNLGGTASSLVPCG